MVEKNPQTKILKMLTDYKTDNLDKLISDDLQTHFYNYKKINLFNKKIKYPLQKIWIRTPKLKVFKPTFPLSDKKNTQVVLSLILSPNLEDIKKFFLFIQGLEEKVKDIIYKKTKNKNLVLKSSISKIQNFPNFLNVNLPYHKINGCYEFLFNIYNHQNKRVNLKSISSGSYVSSFIELSEVWIKYNQTNIEYGFNWNVLQLKIYPEFDFSICLFNDENNSVESKSVYDECYHCLYCPNNHPRTHFCSDEKLGIYENKDNYIFSNKNKNTLGNIGGFIPSIKDLLSVKLKPIKKSNIIQETKILKSLNENIKNELLKKVNERNLKKINKINDKMENMLIEADLEAFGNDIDKEKINDILNLKFIH